MTILDHLADHARHRVAEAKKQVPPEALKRQALAAEKGHFVFENAIKKFGFAAIELNVDLTAFGMGAAGTVLLYNHNYIAK